MQAPALVKMWDTSCVDWKDRILQGLVPIRDDLPLFRGEADRALRMFKRLKIPDVTGTPLMGDVCGDWLFRIVEVIFGCYDPKLQRRMIKEFFLLIPKKNSKSSSAASIMIVAALMNKRPNSEFLLIAPTKEIAFGSFKQACDTIKIDPVLAAKFKPVDHKKRIDFIDESHPGRGSYIIVKAADTDTITGVKSLGVLIDETHEFAEKSKAPHVFTELKGALASKPDGFIIQITTQSKVPPAGVFKSELHIAREVREGKIKLPYLPVLYELPFEMQKDGGWKNRSVWGLVNPNLNRSVDPMYLEGEMLKAEIDGPGKMALIASQHFNVEIGIGHLADGWPGAMFWDLRADPTLTLESLVAQCEVITCGVDGGGLDDLFSVSFVGRKIGTREWLHWEHTWADKIVLERRKSEAQRLLDFQKQGHLTIVDNITLAFNEAAEMVAGVELSGKLDKIGFDPIGVGLIIDALALKGVANPPPGIEGEQKIVSISQGYKLQGAIKTAEVKLSSGELTHAAHPIMAWAAGNARVEPKGNAITITKQNSGTAKIDPLMSLFDAVALMSLNPTSKRSVYEDEDVAI